MPGGTPYFIGQAPRFPFAYRCFRCNRKTILTAQGWAMLPNVEGQLEQNVEPAKVRDLGHGTKAS